MASQREIDALYSFQEEMDAIYFVRPVDISPREERLRWIGERLGKAAVIFDGLERNQRLTIENTLRRQLVPELSIACARFAQVASVPSLARGLAHIKPAPYDLEDAWRATMGVRIFVDETVVEAENRDFRGNFHDRVKNNAVYPLHQAAAGLCLRYELGDLWKLHIARYDKIVENIIEHK